MGDLPCCFFIGELCCLGGTVKCTSCYDQDGCVAAYSKCCCSLVGMEYPPDNTPGIGVGPVRCMGNLEGRTPADCSSEAAKAELDTFQKTLWCLSCYCCYTGYTYDINPLCSQEGKLCCCYINVESAYCCSDDGLCCKNSFGNLFVARLWGEEHQNIVALLVHPSGPVHGWMADHSKGCASKFASIQRRSSAWIGSRRAGEGRKGRGSGKGDESRATNPERLQCTSTNTNS